MILPINESAVMKAHLAEWISESVTVMNEKKQEKVMHCWELEKTGLLAIWDVNEQATLVPKAFADTSRLFPGNNNNDDSGLANEEDDNAPELSHDFSCAIVTRVNSETGEKTTKEADEEEEVENELVAAVVANAQSGRTLFSYFEVAKL